MFITVLAVIFEAALIALTAAMSFRLSGRLKRSLYTYENIELTAGIVYIGGFAAVLAVNLVRDLITGQQISLNYLINHLINSPRNFSYYALIPFGVLFLLMCISNVVLMLHEGFRPKNALGIVFSIAYLGGTAFIYWLSDFISRKMLLSGIFAAEKWVLISETIIPLFFLLIICYLECILAGTAFLGLLAAKQKPKYDKDFIIIPGCAISKTGRLLPLLRGRANRAVKYAWQQEIACGKPVKYVPTGGQGADEIMSEGSALELYLLSHGAEEYEVLAEKKSSNTLENFKFAKELIDAEKPDAKIAFATTNYHMLRCGMLAYSLGIEDIEGIASDTKWYFWPNGFLREFVAILNMHREYHKAFVVLDAAICVLAAIVLAII